MSETEVAAPTSVELGRRVAERAERRLLIDGKLVEATGGAGYPNVSPATGLVLGEAAAATADDMRAAIAAARRAFDETDWSSDRELRKRCLTQLQAALEAEKEELREEIIAEVGSPDMATRNAQLDWPLQEALNYPIRLIDEFEWERTLDGGGLFGPKNIRKVVKEAVGVVAAITPSNYPIEVILNKLGPALAAGNTVVLKPDPNAPWTGLRLGRLIAEKTDFPAGVVNVVTTPDNDVAGILASDPRVDLISFTGSTAVGKHLMREGADSFKRVFLELGGKSALIVLDDADPGKIVMGAMGTCQHAGQGCAINTRLLVHRSLYDTAVASVKAGFSMAPIGDPADPGVLTGPLITAKAKDKVLSMIAEAREAGGEVIVGGGVPENLPEHLADGHYVQPTAITGVGPDSAIAQEEVFGPVLVIIPFDTDDEAVAIANSTRFGLAGAVLSGDLDRGMAVANRIRTGSIGVNGGMFYSADAPFGGFGASGIGRQCGIEGFEQYLETRTIAYREPSA